jgi:hypothetical protein
MNVILLVTWLIPGQPPSNYQTPFSSMETCQVARSAVLAEAVRLNAEQDKYAARIRSQGGVVVYDPPPKQVTAVCVTQ